MRNITTLRLRSPADLLGAIPYVMGFHPADSLVMVGLTGRGELLRTTVTGRVDLPLPGDTASARARTVQLLECARSNDIGHAVIIAYGAPDRADHIVELARAELTGAGIALRDVLRVAGGRYWSYLCDDPSCCPPEGVIYQGDAGRVAAEATVAGLVALPGREVIERSLVPDGTTGGAAMRSAISEAEERLGVTRAAHGTLAGRTRMIGEGVPLVRAAIERYARGERLGDGEVATLAVALTHTRVRDEAWARLTGAWRHAHLALWQDVTRRLDDDYVCAPATLLALAAWQDGNGALANVAVERALRADPHYPMATLVRCGLANGLPPSTAYPPLAPDELGDGLGGAVLESPWDDAFDEEP